MDLFAAIEARRSVRIFGNELVPDHVIDKALDAALLAPNSSNMQTWRFYWVQNASGRQEFVEACLNQNAAKTAKALIVAVSDKALWRKNNPRLLAHLKETGVKSEALKYYEKLMPFVYGMALLSPLKWVIFNAMGLFKPAPRHPWSPRDVQEVSVKSCALACENFMLAISAQGYDTCPMEGIDEKRMKQLLKLGRTSTVVMALAVGKRTPEGIWGERFRFPKEEVVYRL